MGPTTPAAFGGTWSGLLTQNSGTFNVKLTLTAGQSSGSIVYTFATFDCSGDLNLTSATATSVTMSQGIVVNHNCVDGTVTLSLTGSGSMNFNFQTPGTGPATGTLTRQ